MGSVCAKMFDPQNNNASERSPGLAQFLHMRTHEIMPYNFDGIKFIFSKSINNHFGTNHIINITNGPDNGYRFGTLFTGNKDWKGFALPMFQGEINTAGHLIASITQQVNCMRFVTVVHYENSVVFPQLTFDWIGKNSTTSISASKVTATNYPEVLESTYLRTITNHWSFGIRGYYRLFNNLWPTPECLARYECAPFGCSVSISPHDMQLCHYFQVNENLRLGFMLNGQLRDKRSFGQFGYQFSCPKKEITNGSSHRPMEEILPCPITTDSSHSPLHEAAITGDFKQLEQFLRAGADRNAKDTKHGNTPLHEAAWRGYSKCVKALCVLPKPSKESKQPKSKHLKDAVQNTHGTMHSSLLGTRNAGGFSPLHLAAQNGHNQSCREILLAGGDPDVQNNYGDTPLHTACRYGHAGATRILLSAKCDPQRVNLNGDTPLHISCAMGRRKLTRILLYAGSSLQTCNSQGETARDIAIRKKLPEILQILDAPIDENAREKERDRSSSSSRHNKKDEKKAKKCDKTKCKGEVDPKNWSPYGCHYFPDPRSFPSPKLETLPKEPLNTGEQYFLDLAGNIRKGPVGVGNTCYCGPFFRHIEERISRNKKSIKKYVHKATEKLDSKVQALALKTEDQIERISKNMLADRIRCDEQRLNVEQWLKRGDRARATVSAHTQKSRKDETNTNTLTRCRSLELLDNNNLMENIELMTSGLRRSYDDILDIGTHQVVVHHDAESGTRSTHGTVRTDSERRNSMLEFNKEWHNQDLEKDKSSISDKIRVSSSEQDRNSLENRSDSELSKRIKNMELRSGVSVAERLEELLSKTNEIIEMERSCRKKSKDAFGALNSQISKRRIRGSEHLRVSASSNKSSSDGDVISHQLRSQSKHYPEMDDTAFIAKEMEKITSSLLGHSHGKEVENSEKHSPVSPEIAKEFISQKERNGHIDNEHERSSVLSGSSRRSAYSSDLNKHAQSPTYSNPEIVKSEHSAVQGRNETRSHMLSAMLFSSKDANAKKFSNRLTDVADVVDGFSGFYQNSCFDDGNSSDGDTVKSEKHHGNVKPILASDNKYQGVDIGSSDIDDQCELSEMANMKQLNELKSRILNGAHWRNQLRKSSQLEATTREDDPRDDQVNGIATTYEIKNCEIKTLKSNQQTFADVHGAPSAGTANEVGTTNPSNGISYDENRNDSESSEDEDEFPSVSQFDSQNIEKSLRYLDALKPPQRVDAPQGSSLYVNQSYKAYGQPDLTPSTPMYHLTKPQLCNGASHISQSFKSPVPKILDTRCLIPKDAYFHDLPNKHRLIPITDTLPEINYSANQMHPTSAGISTAGRNRNPLPISLSIDDNEFRSDNATHYSNTGGLPSYGNMSPYQQYPSPHQLAPPTFSDRQNSVPEQEKLLTSRKFGSSLDTEFKSHALMGSTYSIDQVQLERDLNNDSGYSTKVSGSISSRPSPNSSSGHNEIEMSKGNDLRIHYDGYYMPGASSLV